MGRPKLGRVNQVQLEGQSTAINGRYLLPRAQRIQTAEPVLDGYEGRLDQIGLGVFWGGEDL
jgi:hypothetical protein